LLSSWDDRSADDLFADNVALDDAYERRRAAATAVGGPLRLDGVRATSRTSATATVASGDTTWTLELQLSPQVPPRVQWYELTKVDSSPAEGT
jgi:hypothetical protein